jgi:anaerobic magnesium-protoporphyrin IX monomethyl ester cyclase
MKERICLIIPPSPFLLDERVFPFLGILQIGSVLIQNGIPVDMLDLSKVENYAETTGRYAESQNTEIFGITSNTSQMPGTAKIISAIRKAKPRAKIILGGPHCTLVNAGLKKCAYPEGRERGEKALRQLSELADVIVCGDGEKAILEAIKPGKLGIIDCDNPISPYFLTKEDIDELPFPARSLIDLGSYHYEIETAKATSLLSQRGCPFGCRFCGGRLSPTYRRTRSPSIRKVIDEMKWLNSSREFRGFMFYDDELNVNPNFIRLMNEIALEQERIGQEWLLRGFLKAELFTDEQAEAMYKAGCKLALFGFESGSPVILETINKKSTIADNTKCFEIARKHGLKVKALMSIGHPGESAKTIRETEEWVRAMRPDDFDITIITVYPGTEYFNNALPVSGEKDLWVYRSPNGKTLCMKNVNFLETPEFFKGKPGGGYACHVSTEDLSSVEILKERDRMEENLRRDLDIPWNQMSAPEKLSLDTKKDLPDNVLRSSFPI